MGLVLDCLFAVERADIHAAAEIPSVVVFLIDSDVSPGESLGIGDGLADGGLLRPVTVEPLVNRTVVEVEHGTKCRFGYLKENPPKGE